MDLEIEGIEELIDYLEKIDSETEPIIDKALIAGGDYLKEQMKSGVYSHGLTRRTGQAERAIVRTDPKNSSLYVGTQGGKKQPGYYLYMHEFGFFNVRARRFIAPRPFASIVYENNKDAILEKYAEVFRREWGI